MGARRRVYISAWGRGHYDIPEYCVTSAIDPTHCIAEAIARKSGGIVGSGPHDDGYGERRDGSIKYWRYHMILTRRDGCTVMGEVWYDVTPDDIREMTDEEREMDERREMAMYEGEKSERSAS